MDDLNVQNDDAKDTPVVLYVVEIEVMVKDFASQKIGTPKISSEIHCDSPEEFCESLWHVVEPFIEKQIFYNDDTLSYEWSQNELNAKDLHKFVVFQDKVSKRTYEVLAVTKKLLLSWKNKKGIICFVHGYGTILKKKHQYELALKQIIQPGTVDRAGATDLIATEASWLRWANWIQKQTGPERD
ncbi:hypothetical protein Bhyg_12268, partial [Pseudolycoriella hygida]